MLGYTGGIFVLQSTMTIVSICRLVLYSFRVLTYASEQSYNWYTRAYTKCTASIFLARSFVHTHRAKYDQNYTHRMGTHHHTGYLETYAHTCTHRHTRTHMHMHAHAQHTLTE